MDAATPTAVVVDHRLAGLNGTQPDQSSSAVNFYRHSVMKSSPERGPLGPCYIGSEVNSGTVFASFLELKLLTFGSVSLGQAGVTPD